MKKKKRLFLLLIPVFLLYIIIGLKNDLTVTEYDYYSEKLPAAFDGFKILQISDLHCENFGTEQSELLQAVHACEPDIIVLTGDIVDEDHTSVKAVYDLIVGLNKQYPIYYITGNHELNSSTAQNYRDMLNIFLSYDVTLLDDQSVALTKGDDSIYLYGQKFRSLYVTNFIETPNTDKFNILLYHASDYFDLIAPYNYDLVFSGHLHGGVVRLPLVGGLLGADGSFFPTYTKGMYTKADSTLIASSGLGDTRIPRFYNDPEIVVVTLHSSSD